LGFARTQTPVTAVQLSRGKGEAHLLFEIHLLMADIGRLATDLILFYSREFSYVALPAMMTTGSSIMPQKRNPDVFELIRARSATSLSCLVEVLSVSPRLTSGYHRDLQIIKAPLFRGIDLAGDVLRVLARALGGIRFVPENIQMDKTLYATEEAYRMVVDDGIPFREAYRRVAERLRGSQR
jgi:argininosuccinate lyase